VASDISGGTFEAQSHGDLDAVLLGLSAVVKVDEIVSG